MNRKNKFTKGISKKILFGFMVSGIMFTIGLGVLFVGANWFFSQFTWYSGDLLYEILKWLKGYIFPILILVWMIGICVIFFIYWRKVLGFISSVAEAGELMARDDDQLVKLPPELEQIERSMNEVKIKAAQNARAAREAEQRKNDLVVYLAHDLKTPLTSVIGYLTLLKDEPDISEELREKYLTISLDKAERLEDLINEFFEITRFNLSKLTLELSTVNLNRMLEQTAYEFKPVFLQKNLEYTLNFSGNIDIKCDVDKMERVFDNLLRNAVSYSFENTSIDIAAEKKENGIFISFTNKGNTIPAEKLERIFERFFRLDSSRASKSGGAGLGLAIAKEIVEAHKGKITAESFDDTIVFKIFLPQRL